MTVEPVSVETLVLAVSALVIGLSKTSVGGFAALAVAAFAAYLPTKESTAAVLLLLIIGDVVAVARYRRSANWPLLRRLLPSVLPGVALGAVFLRLVDDRTLRLSIGLMLTAMVVTQLMMRPRAEDAGAEPNTPPARRRPALSLAAGTAAGFTTMTANAAGPIMMVYLLACRVDKMASSAPPGPTRSTVILTLGTMTDRTGHDYAELPVIPTQEMPTAEAADAAAAWLATQGCRQL